MFHNSDNIGLAESFLKLSTVTTSLILLKELLALESVNSWGQSHVERCYNVGACCNVLHAGRGHGHWLQWDRRVLEHDFPRRTGPLLLHFAVR